MRLTFLRAVATAAIVGLGSATAGAAVTFNNEVNDTPDAYDSQIATTLITAGQASLASQSASRAPDNGFAAGGVNNGSASGTALGSPTTLTSNTFFNDLRTPATISFKLSQAYNITSIRTLAGWGDTYFGSQNFTVAFETNNSGTYGAPIGTFGTQGYTGTPPPGLPAVADPGFATRTTITDDAGGFVGTNVTGVQFVYSDPYASLAQFNGTVIRELSVTGTPVPEPAALGVVGLGALGLLRRRRR